MDTHDVAHGSLRRKKAQTLQYQHPINCKIAKCSAISMYERELEKNRHTEAKLKKALSREHALLLKQNELIKQKDTLSKESEHRLLNGLQLISSLLSIQSRAAKNTETAEQLTNAANRVATLGRVHHHLHALDHTENVEFKQYLQKLCRDLSEMASNEGIERDLQIEGAELNIPTVTAIPLGFIANELITNSIKYGKGRITVQLQSNVGSLNALSISDEGPGLPEGFDPAGTKGIGMKLVSALIRQIGGELQISRGENDQGTRFTVLFA
jgi:two-component system, sensor histidine kinase PdtaS